MNDQQQTVAQAIWQTLAMRGGIPSLPQHEVQTLVEALAAGIVAATNTVPQAAPPTPPQPANGHDAPEQTLWEGESKDLGNVASGGRIAQNRYRVTTQRLHFQNGILSTNAEQVPLWAIRDLDMKQSMTQKIRNVGNVIVHVEHSDYTGRSEVVLENVEQPAHVRDLINEHAQRERLEYQRRHQTRYYGRQ